MTPSIPDSQLEQFIHDSGWKAENNAGPKARSIRDKAVGKEVLVFYSGTSIRVFDTGGFIYHLAFRQRHINPSLCSHEGRLYDGVGGHIRDTLTDNIVAKREGDVIALCSHKGRMYDGGTYSGVFDTLSSRIIVDRKPGTLDLYSDGKQMYEGRIDGLIADILGEEQTIPLTGEVPAICEHEGVLYFSTSEGLSSSIYSYPEKKESTNVKFMIRSLASYAGDLLFSGTTRFIHNTRSQYPMARIGDDVHAMCTHPRKNLVQEGILPP